MIIGPLYVFPEQPFTKDLDETVERAPGNTSKIGQKRPRKRNEPCPFPLENGVLFVKFVRGWGRGVLSSKPIFKCEKPGSSANLSAKADSR
ncbi:MAG: hypothetical protein AUJ07_07775 [Crenarchaeota archaeon 13_1_40CM_3_53_5]|nr:MAG: hypothetical protein AUJ07_07775 [Crenarchaeota archaeon 13_1_40CM_3_53_5]